MVAGQILCHQYYMIGRPLTGLEIYRSFFMPAAARNISLDPDYRLDPFSLHLVIEGERAIEIPMVRDRNRGHLELCCALGQRAYLDRPIQQAVIGVKMQMDKLFITVHKHANI